VNYDTLTIPARNVETNFLEEASMDLKQLAEWVEARICAPCKQGYTCDDFECDQAKKIADILRRMVPFRGKDGDGKDVSGWLVPD
jgi:hypothetical protein